MFSSRKLLPTDGQAFDAENITDRLASSNLNASFSGGGSKGGGEVNEKLKEDLLVLDVRSSLF